MRSTGSPGRNREGDRSSEEVLNVTFIGDDPPLAELYRLKLELDGYWVTMATTLAEGLQRIHDEPPDIVFLDLGLAHQGTPDALGILRHDPALRGLPVVLVARERGTPAVNGLQLGSRDFLITAAMVPSLSVWADHSTAALPAAYA